MAAYGAAESAVLKGRRYSTANDDTVNISLPGWQNETIMHSDGTFDIKKTRQPGKISGLNVKCDDGKEDVEYLAELAAGLEPFTVSITKVDGTVYTGRMMITDQGELDLSTGYVELTLEGDLEKMA